MVIVIDFPLSRTLSNWVYELDKWAPSVVKIAYKVRKIVYVSFLFASIEDILIAFC